MTPRCPKCFMTPCECAVTIAFKPSEPLPPLPTLPEQQEQNRRMSETFENVVSIGAARFNKESQDPAECNPRDALEAAIAYFDHADDKPDHIIVLFGRTPEDGGSATKWFQAGSYQYHAQIGLLYEGGQMIRENG